MANKEALTETRTKLEGPSEIVATESGASRKKGA